LLGKTKFTAIPHDSAPLFSRENWLAAFLWLAVTLIAVLMCIGEFVRAPLALILLVVLLATLNGFCEGILWRGLYVRGPALRLYCLPHWLGQMDGNFTQPERHPGPDGYLAPSALSLIGEIDVHYSGCASAFDPASLTRLVDSFLQRTGLWHSGYTVYAVWRVALGRAAFGAPRRSLLPDYGWISDMERAS
jgi:hypothetical protein